MENKKVTIKDQVAALSRTVKFACALAEADNPGCKQKVLDMLICELEFMAGRQRPVTGSGTCGNNEPAESCGEPDYMERMKQEYRQLKARYDNLHRMCVRYEAGTLDFTPSCSLELLKEQKAAMGNYLRCLEVRAEIERIKLL